MKAPLYIKRQFLAKNKNNVDFRQYLLMLDNNLNIFKIVILCKHFCIYKNVYMTRLLGMDPLRHAG
jgi:hypothetical protein